MTTKPVAVSIAIPTYRRERVLVETIGYLLALSPPADEILVLDQTERHEPETEAALAGWAASGAIRWLRLPEPSIPKAMNQGLLHARGEIVLFLDDDIRPEPALVAAHRAAHEAHPGALIAGRVIQPWHEGKRFPAEERFHFACIKGQWVDEFMGGNFSVRRAQALAIGGFDENFVRVAYRFEAEFAHRFRASGGRIWFEPAACLHHLQAGAGGTRSYGDHLTTWRPDHAVGAYYFSLRSRQWGELLMRPWHAVATRYHLRHPWRVLPTLWAEVRGLLWAWRLHRQGPALISASTSGALGAS
ncbi:MAG: glycosyltransferase family 2 protein [Casimicrobiaceae bacterium]